jgi:hypothetical protein
MRKTILLLFALSACGGSGDSQGASIRLSIGGVPHEVPGVYAEFQKFLGGSYVLDLDTDKPGTEYGSLMSVFLATDKTRLTELVGKPLERSYAQDNPQKLFMNVDANTNYIESGKKFYQAYTMKVTVRSVADKKIVLDLQGTYLEFALPLPDDDAAAPPTGKEVQVSGQFTVPLISDESN